jgi:hypothetical protein
MALATTNDFDVHQMDVKTTFLNGYLQKENYMEQAQGFIQLRTHHKVYKLHKTFNGFTQSLRAWYERIDSFLLTSGFKKSVVNTNVYIFTQDNRFMILALYVDDAILISNDANRLLKQFQSKLAKEFAMTNLGHIQYCLGIHIKRDRLNHTIYMHQAKYIETKLQMFKLEMSKVVATPLEVGLKLTKAMSPQIESKKKHMKKVPYQSSLGSLMYYIDLH